MSVIPTSYMNVVVLKPGEPFTLPPGGRLIASTNPTALDSTCEVGNLETLKCYAFVFGNAEEDGNDEQLFEDGTFPVTGVSVNGTYSEFSSVFNPIKDNGSYNLAGLVEAINAKTGGLLISPTIGEHGEGDHGKISFIAFKTVPSIAKSLELRMIAASTEGFNIDEGIHLWIKARDYDELSMYSGLPACTDGSVVLT